MFLKQMILNGFKSFGNKTIINFDSNVTGVIGPNGSGKSNIIDAVK
jgi:chromosome segregation protein